MKVENIRLCLYTAQKRSLEVCPSVPRSCETRNPDGKSFQTSKKPGPERICVGVKSSYVKPGVNVRTHRQMGVGFLRKGGLGEVVSGQERMLTVCFGLGVLFLRRGMKGGDWPTRTKLRMTLGQT